MWKVKVPDASTLSVEAKDQFTLSPPAQKAAAKPAPNSRRPWQAAEKLVALKGHDFSRAAGRLKVSAGFSH